MQTRSVQDVLHSVLSSSTDDDPVTFASTTDAQAVLDEVWRVRSHEIVNNQSFTRIRSLEGVGLGRTAFRRSRLPSFLRRPQQATEGFAESILEVQHLPDAVGATGCSASRQRAT